MYSVQYDYQSKLRRKKNNIHAVALAEVEFY